MNIKKKLFNVLFKILNLNNIFRLSKSNNLRNLYEENRHKAPLKSIANLLNCSLGTAHNKINGKTIIRNHEMKKILNFYKELNLSL